MMRIIFLVITAVVFLTGCPLASIPSSPSPVISSNVDLYPKVLPPPKLEDYVNPNIHVDVDGLEEYRSALADYREYLQRYERVITRRYNLTALEPPAALPSAIEPQVRIEERIVYVDRPVTTPNVPQVINQPCPLRCPPVVPFTPLYIPNPPTFKSNEDTDHVIIDGLMVYIEDLVRRIKQHNEDHNKEPQ